MNPIEQTQIVKLHLIVNTVLEEFNREQQLEGEIDLSQDTNGVANWRLAFDQLDTDWRYRSIGQPTTTGSFYGNFRTSATLGISFSAKPSPYHMTLLGKLHAALPAKTTMLALKW